MPLPEDLPLKRRLNRRVPGPGLLLLAGLPAALALGVYLIWYFPYFFVKKVEVEGLRVLRKAEVVQAMDLKPQTTIYGARLGRLKAGIRQSPWVEDVKIQRVFHDTLHVFLKERKPVAQIKVAWKTPASKNGKKIKPAPTPGVRYYILDRDGLLLSVRSGPWKDRLVEFVGTNLKEARIGEKVVVGHLETLLKAVQAGEHYTPGQVARFELEKGARVVLVTNEGLPVRLGRVDTVMEKIPYLRDLLIQVKAEQNRTGARVKEVDFSNPDYPHLKMDRPVQPGN